ncbi:glycoside hydrolase family 28 protein [Microthyrium microscopicum]|uniref:Glycoside hydrolase family 28 protein n=1 Tax=Microthyrium microscopicum TaxID=703497 RepID=A0A6A6UER1_9PEZI|nr:glycoside hydrolase family 28 protein [Microthyrium microscopicum]
MGTLKVLLLLVVQAVLAITLFVDVTTAGKTCEVASKGNSGDDTDAILSAFKSCGQNGRIVFGNQVYYVKRVMNTTGLRNVQIELRGKILARINHCLFADTTYWLEQSQPIGYQNMSTVWWLGGDNITFDGFGTGTIDGNGQVWYDLVKGYSNYPRRPMGLTIVNTTNSIFRGLRFVQSQMWTMTILRSQNVLLTDIFVNSTSRSRSPARNTDGADTLFVNNITFRGWKVINGDDGISLKANSSNVLIEDCDFYGLGFALGSIGQYKGIFEHIENVTVRGIRYFGTQWPAYIKTWTGVAKGYPPNGGGGGFGFSNVTVTRAYGAFQIGQCTHFRDGGQDGDCDTSRFQIRDIRVSDIKGTITKDSVASLKCSASAPCSGLSFSNISLKRESGASIQKYSCANVVDPKGFNCGL